MAEVIAKATDVEVIYGDKPALDKINMSVKKGDIYALIGKNRCYHRNSGILSIFLCGTQSGILSYPAWNRRSIHCRNSSERNGTLRS